MPAAGGRGAARADRRAGPARPGSGRMSAMAPFVHRLRVRYHECDPQGIVFNANHFAYFDVALTELWRAAFGSYGAMVASGTDVHVVDASATFHAPARFDDELDLSMAIAALGTSSHHQRARGAPRRRAARDRPARARVRRRGDARQEADPRGHARAARALDVRTARSEPAPRHRRLGSGPGPARRRSGRPGRGAPPHPRPGTWAAGRWPARAATRPSRSTGSASRRPSRSPARSAPTRARCATSCRCARRRGPRTSSCASSTGPAGARRLGGRRGGERRHVGEARVRRRLGDRRRARARRGRPAGRSTPTPCRAAGP